MEQIIGRIEQLTNEPTPVAHEKIRAPLDEVTRAEIRKIVREEIGSFVENLEALSETINNAINATITRLSESGILQNSSENAEKSELQKDCQTSKLQSYIKENTKEPNCIFAQGAPNDKWIFSAPPLHEDFCPHCEVYVRHGNFCPLCGTKLHDSCECWVLEKPFNCGQAECPGLNLFIDPKLKALLPQPQADKKSV